MFIFEMSAKKIYNLHPCYMQHTAYNSKGEIKENEVGCQRAGDKSNTVYHRSKCCSKTTTKSVDQDACDWSYKTDV